VLRSPELWELVLGPSAGGGARGKSTAGRATGGREGGYSDAKRKKKAHVSICAMCSTGSNDACISLAALETSLMFGEVRMTALATVSTRYTSHDQKLICTSTPSELHVT
jgi:hypothetical protein